MKTLIISCLLLVSVFVVKGQSNATELTKEETLHWLSNYANDLIPDLVNYGTDLYHVCVLEFTEDKIKIHRQAWGKNGSMVHHFVSTVEYKNIYLQDLSRLSLETDITGFWDRKNTKDVAIFTIKTMQDQVDFNNQYKSTDINIPCFILESKKGAKKDVLRIIKAIMHMAKLSGAKQVPNVNKDTF